MEPAVSDSGWVTLVAGVFGSLIGSFLNVCIVRWPAEQSVVRPRSRCPKCGYQITWYDNVPVVSWIALRGRCRHCRTAIPLRYPALELGVGTVFALVARFAPALAVPFLLVTASGLIATATAWLMYGRPSGKIAVVSGVSIVVFALGTVGAGCFAPG